MTINWQWAASDSSNSNSLNYTRTLLPTDSLVKIGILIALCLTEYSQLIITGDTQIEKRSKLELETSIASPDPARRNKINPIQQPLLLFNM